jgi:hypothetical protein
VVDMGVLNEIIHFLNLHDGDIPEIFTLESMDKIFNFIMLSKLMHPEIFTDKWKETWEHFDEKSELEQQFILSLRTVCELFNEKNQLIN